MQQPKVWLNAAKILYLLVKELKFYHSKVFASLEPLLNLVSAFVKAVLLKTKTVKN